MLDPQVVVNLLPELRVGVNLMRRGCRPGERFMGAPGRLVQPGVSVRTLHFETNEFHKRLSVWVDCSKSARKEEPFSRVLLKRPRFRLLGAPSESGDRARRCLSEG